MPTHSASVATERTIASRESSSVASRVKLDLVTLGLFTSAIFTSATLLFVVQPMVGKILLPNLGGAPAVWNTCMVFFQATLLAGYLTAHLLSKYVSFRYQIAIYVVGLIAAMQSLPIQVGPEWIDQLVAGKEPVTWLLAVLFAQVAPVFFVLSTTSPLMQKWFAKSGHPQGSDPYFLYAASNVGSILALLAYPLVVEASLGVSEQTHTWMLGFGFFAILATCSGIAGWFGSNTASLGGTGIPVATTNGASQAATSPTWQRRGFWVLLAFIPSSLMLGVTTYVSTDVSAIPLIWVVPLTMYLLTFVLAFSKRQLFSPYWMGRIASLLVLVIMVTVVLGANDPPTVIVPLHLLMFFTVAMFCHQRLAGDRPNEEHLTDFYLWLSVGGVLGGIFNALVAPTIFTTIIEYPLIIALAPYWRLTKSDVETEPTTSDNDRQPTTSDASPWTSRARIKEAKPDTLASALVFGGGTFCALVALSWVLDAMPQQWITAIENATPFGASQIETLLVFAVPAALVLHNIERRTHFTFGLVAIFLVSVFNQYTDSDCLQRGRNFYGTIATQNAELSGGNVVKMFHGNTVHGWQWKDDARRQTPLTYYGKSSGAGRLIADRQQSNNELQIGAIGLGAGTMAAILRPNDAMTYYEINPQVVDHAEKYFTYLSDARERGADVDIRLGDARLVLDQEERSGQADRYDILVVDAFSSDAIPAHLITNECFQVYLDRIEEDGALAVHISNRFLNLAPVLAKLCEANEVVGYAYCFDEIPNGHAFDPKTGETASLWILIARDLTHLATFESDRHARVLKASPDLRLWTDDYSNVLSAFNFRL